MVKLVCFMQETSICLFFGFLLAFPMIGINITLFDYFCEQAKSGKKIFLYIILESVLKR
jgi:hypothetical protein